MVREDSLTKLYWFGLGLWITFPRHMLWIAAEDILAGSLKSTAIVLIVFAIPEMFSRAIASPLILKRISFLSAVLLFSFTTFTIQLIFVFVNIVNVRLAGMCVLGFANGFAVIATAKLLGYYRESAGVYMSGDNVASVLASILYTGLSTWACVSPRITIAILSPLSLLPLLIYTLLDKEPLKANKISVESFAYHPLDHRDEIMQSVTPAGEKRSKQVEIWRQLKLLFQEFLLVYYYGAITFLMQLSLTSILSTLTFKSSPFHPRDHYQYYRFLNDIGMMVGGMELSLVSFFCPGFLDTIKIRRIWILFLLGVGHVMVLLSASWFHYTDNVYIIFILCFTQGVTTGCAFVHLFSLTADLITDSTKLGTVLGYLEVSASVGRLAAGLLGVFEEKYLREQCSYRLLLGRFCLARLPSLEMWTTSNCKK